LIFLIVAVIFHVAMKYTRYGKFTYAIGANAQAARVSGINVEKHLVKLYIVAATAGRAGRDRGRGARPDRAGRHGHDV
jgi:ribose/xylose/arabinose/galactoside ABC-type transport system permease subunit